jgi:hypothetical protein
LVQRTAWSKSVRQSAGPLDDNCLAPTAKPWALEEDDDEEEAGSSLERSPLLLDTLTQDDADDLAECGHDIGGAGDDLVDFKEACSVRQAKESKKDIVDCGKGWQPSC